MDDGFGHWFAGFVDGEGCFEVRKSTAGGCLRYVPRFSLVLREDDKAILLEIQDRLGAGCIAKRNKPGGVIDQYQLIIETRRDCPKLVDVFDRYPLRAKKAREYPIWREAVMEWLSSTGPRNWDVMYQYQCRIREERRYKEEEYARV